MSAKLPCGGFKWIDGTKEMITEWDEDGDVGYFFEVDVKYQKELHHLHNMLPFLPEKMLTNDKNKVEKLVPNLRDKKNYVFHVAVLKQALKHGLVIEKINRTITFEQKAWMKDYIDFNMQLRTNAKNDFEKDLFKLMNSSIFGKTMENLRNICKFYLLETEEKMLLKAREPNFKEKCIFSDYLFGAMMSLEEVTMSKPVYVGAAILDIRKTVMYEFHYDYMMPMYGPDHAVLLYMDMDRFVYHIHTEDFYGDIAGDVKERFDTSAYRGDYPMKTGLNKKFIGLTKVETPDREIIEFIALRPKLYAYRFARAQLVGDVTGKTKIDGCTESKCKGVKKCVKETTNIKNYFEVLMGGLSHLDIVQYNFRTKNHTIYTERKEKKAITANDDKRIVLSDKIHTAAIGFNPVSCEL